MLYLLYSIYETVTIYKPFTSRIANSEKYLTEAPGAIDNSSIANKSEQWQKNVYGGREVYLKKHGHYPNQPPYVSKDEVIKSIKKIKNEKRSC